MRLIFACIGTLFILCRQAVHFPDFSFPEDIHDQPYQRIDQNYHERHYQYGYDVEGKPMQQQPYCHVCNEYQRAVGH